VELRQVTVADHALLAVLGLQIGMFAEKIRDLGLDRLGDQGTCPIAQDFGELIVEDSWLNQLDNVIVGQTAYRSFGGEVEASSTPMICRLPDSRRHQLLAIALTSDAPLSTTKSKVIAPFIRTGTAYIPPSPFIGTDIAEE
jgi:hypothetical protein